MTAIRPVVASVVLASLFAAPLVAGSNYAYLKDVFEGRRVTVRLDMPATSDGVNVHVDSRRGLDVNEYRNNLRRYGVAIREGESAMVTLVKVKSDLIEFQLGGGGYGTFFDDTDTSADIPYIGKSDRERSLERQLRDETDRNRRRQLERELDVLRDRRERENHRIRIERERISEYKQERLAFRRLQAGSRFNIRYRDRVPYDLRAEDIMDALAEYVDFNGRRRR